MPKRSEFPKFNFSGVKCKAKCVEIYDGDTITLEVSLGDLVTKYDPEVDASQLPVKIYPRCRMLHYNCAELKSRDPTERESAIKARDHLKSLILNKVVNVEFDKNDLYGRPLILVHIPEDSLSMTPGVTMIHEHMITGGYANKYEGKGEKSFPKMEREKSD